MIQARAWPVRAMYILIAAALAISLFITAAPAQKVSGANNDVKAEWERVDTPTLEGWVLAPESTIIDYALASAGEVAYAIVDSEYNVDGDYFLLKSDDHAATWDDITAALEDLLDITDDDVVNDDYINELVLVATDWEDPDFVAVALEWYDYSANTTLISVFVSIDGGETFVDADWVEDGGAYFDDPYDVSDLAVSYEDDGERDIAIGGMDDDGDAALFRCTVAGDNPGNWEDATDYNGWDEDVNYGGSYLVTDLIFSPNWALDRTILAVTVVPFDDDYGYWEADVYLQSAVWGETSAAWNADAGFAPAVRVKEDVWVPYFLMYVDGRGIAGIALPEDYYGDDTDARYAWVWVNYIIDVYDSFSENAVGEILRVRDDSVDAVDTQIPKMPWLTNVSYLGTIAEGKAIAGTLAPSASDYYSVDLIRDCCEGVQVYRNDGITNMEICCLEWDKACKPPTGRTAMAVSYVSEDKAYAVALQGDDGYIGGLYDEGAWSVSFDDGDTWNQLSLIDTYINYLSDVAVSPDCNKTMLVSVNTYGGDCGCDSVWLKAVSLPEAEEYSGKWLRTWCGSLEGSWFEWNEGGLLRLAPEETTGDTVYLVDIGTDTVYYNELETLACWKRGTATVDDIMDLAVLDEATIYALDFEGDVAMSDDHGKTLTWTDPVDSEVEHGWSIAVHGDYVLVGSAWDGEVSYCDDFLADEPEFTLLDETVPMEGDNGHTTVAFDTYFDQNDVIYAAVEGWEYDDSYPYCNFSQGGIYRWVIDESTTWEDMGADNDHGYTGIVLDRPSPANPYTSPETGGVLYASYVGWQDCEYNEYDWSETGVARSLNPAETIECLECVEWDYLNESNPESWLYDWEGLDSVGFEATPDALKICGCLEATSNSRLFAIDSWWYYDMEDGEEGAVWTFEDCYAKKAPDVTLPADNAVIPADPCSCYNAPFTVKWDGLCDACKYELQFALDEDFDSVMESTWVPPEGSKSTTSFLVPGGEEGYGLSCEMTYYVRVRARQAGTDQEIRSWWSAPLKITIAPSVGAAEITLVSPVPGAQGVAVKNVGFSWDLTATADAFDWVLSPNADLSAPVDSKNVTATACTYTGTLTYGTTYYWQVTAFNEGAPISASAVGTFTTAAAGAFCCPLDGLCFDTQQALQAHNTAEHPAQPATPFWVWVVIAIGAVLVIVVIVLIFRTRRV